MRKVTIELKFITAVTGVETSFEKHISDRTRKQCPIPRCLSYVPFPDEHTMFIHTKIISTSILPWYETDIVFTYYQLVTFHTNTI
jgi:hypothetical protein